MHRISILAAALIGAALLLAACGGDDGTATTASPATGDVAAACSTRHCAPAP